MISNGIGPIWFPKRLRAWLTTFGENFFSEASWQRHDEGYARGSPARDVCDRKFLEAMLRDSSAAKTTIKIFKSLLLAVIFWIAVRLFGWLSYNQK